MLVEKFRYYVHEYPSMMRRYDVVRPEPIPNRCHDLVEMRVTEIPLVRRNPRTRQLLAHRFADIGITEIVDAVGVHQATVRVVTIIDLLSITIIDVSRGLQSTVVPVASSL